MSIDWDEVLGDADSTPESILATWMGKVDQIDQIIVAVRNVDGTFSYTTAAASYDQTIGLLETVKLMCFYGHYEQTATERDGL